MALRVDDIGSMDGCNEFARRVEIARIRREAVCDMYEPKLAATARTSRETAETEFTRNSPCVRDGHFVRFATCPIASSLDRLMTRVGSLGSAPRIKGRWRSSARRENQDDTHKKYWSL